MFKQRWLRRKKLAPIRTGRMATSFNRDGSVAGAIGAKPPPKASRSMRSRSHHAEIAAANSGTGPRVSWSLYRSNTKPPWRPLMKSAPRGWRDHWAAFFFRFGLIIAQAATENQPTSANFRTLFHHPPPQRKAPADLSARGAFPVLCSVGLVCASSSLGTLSNYIAHRPQIIRFRPLARPNVRRASGFFAGTGFALPRWSRSAGNLTHLLRSHHRYRLGSDGPR